MGAIFKREVNAYFNSPIFFVTMGIYFVFLGIFYMIVNVTRGYLNFGACLSWLTLILLIIIPIMSMKLIAEEKRSKTLQLLYTSPTSITGIICGKYFATVLVYFIMLLISSIYPIILYNFAPFSVIELLVSYLGFFLLGSVFIAISVFASSLTESQGIAAIIGIGIIFVLWLIEEVNNAISNDIVSTILDWLAIVSKYQDFVNSVIVLSTVVYYISFAALFIIITIRILEKRRWSEG